MNDKIQVYLDTCSLQRPFDDRTQVRVNIEAEAVLTILSIVASGELMLRSSEVIEFELGRMPDDERRERSNDLLRLASSSLVISDEIESQAEAFINVGLKPLDALHLATAVVNRIDVFCTCDDRVLKKRDRLKTSGTRVVSPLELVSEVAK